MSAIDLAAAIVRPHEGCRLTAYPDKGGVWTIGFGHTGMDVHQGLSWTQAQADAALASDLQVAFEAVCRAKTRLLNDRQMAPLVSLAFNVGGHAVAKSNLMVLVNQCRWLEAAKDFLTFDHIAGKEDAAIYLRRLEEAAIFLRASL